LRGCRSLLAAQQLDALHDQHVVLRAILVGQIEKADHAAVGLTGPANDPAGLSLVVVEFTTRRALSRRA
jgi:hypothetical protein